MIIISMEMKMIFIDTGVFLARYLRRDQYHKQSLLIWEKLASSKQQTFTSNFVLDELFTLLGRKADYAFAAKQATIILSSTNLNILRPDVFIEKTAVGYFKKYADQASQLYRLYFICTDEATRYQASI